MIETKTAPNGIDISIQKLNNDLYTRLTKVWPAGIVWNCYGRIYKNREGQDYTAERFMPEASDGKDYADVYWDDSVDVVSFFGTSSKIVTQTRQMVDCHLIVFCNLASLKPDIVLSRADEEVRIDFIRVIGKCLYGFHFNSIETGITNVLREYKAGIVKLNQVDTQPVHAFRINFSLAYNPFQSRTLTIKS